MHVEKIKYKFMQKSHKTEKKTFKYITSTNILFKIIIFSSINKNLCSQNVI